MIHPHVTVIGIVAESPVPDEPSRDLYMELKKRGFHVKYFPISRLSAIIGGDRTAVETKKGPISVDGVFVRGLGLLIDVDSLLRRITLLRMIAEDAVTINHVDALIRTRNKFESVYLLAKNGIPVPTTVATEDIVYAYNATRALGRTVVKPIQGSRGYGSFLVDDPDIAFNIYRYLLTLRKPLFLQEYVEKPNRDIRVMVVGGEPIGCMYRVSERGWKTNVAQGSRGEPCRVNGELAEISVKATEALGLIYSGVDIGEGKDGYVVFEVNGSPDWREFKKTTGVNPAHYLANVMERLVKV